MKSVLHVIPAVAPRYGGPSAAVVGMCRALQHAGIDVCLATTDADGPRRLNVNAGTRQTYEGISTIFFRRALGESYKWSYGLRAWLDAHVAEFDVVHVHAVFSHSSIAAGSACRRAGVPYILRPLGTLDPWSLSQKSWRKRALFAVGARALIRGAAAVHYTSADEMRLAEAAVPDLGRGIVVPLGIDDVFFTRRDEVPSVHTQAPYVLSMSRLDQKKRLDSLISAFHATASVPGLRAWRLVIAGDGEPRFVADLKSLAAAGAAAARITFSGWIAGMDKLALIRDASLFALPSHQENFGISIVEALASGVPAVLSPGVNIASDVVGAGAGWVAGSDDGSFASVLTQAMADDDGRRKAAGRAAGFARIFQWSAVAQQLISAYDAVCPVAGLGDQRPTPAVAGAHPRVSIH